MADQAAALISAMGFIVDRFEGARFTDDPDDAGGPTKYGVTRRLYSEYLGLPPGKLCDVEMIRNLSRDKAIACLIEMFVVRTGLSRIDDDRLRFAVIDFAIHSGPGIAITALQHAASVYADGLFGEITETAVRDRPARSLRDAVIAERADLWADRWHARPSQLKYAAGWVRRLAANLRYGL